MIQLNLDQIRYSSWSTPFLCVCTYSKLYAADHHSCIEYYLMCLFIYCGIFWWLILWRASTWKIMVDFEIWLICWLCNYKLCSVWLINFYNEYFLDLCLLYSHITMNNFSITKIEWWNRFATFKQLTFSYI